MSFMQMLMPASALLFGVALGLRHNVFILIPAGVIAAAVAMCINIAAQDSFSVIVLATIFTTVALEIGYLAGSVITGPPVCQNVGRAHNGPAENTCGPAEVVHFHRYRLAKTP